MANARSQFTQNVILVRCLTTQLPPCLRQLPKMRIFRTIGRKERLLLRKDSGTEGWVNRSNRRAEPFLSRERLMWLRKINLRLFAFRSFLPPRKAQRVSGTSGPTPSESDDLSRKKEDQLRGRGRGRVLWCLRCFSPIEQRRESCNRAL